MLLVLLLVSGGLLCFFYANFPPSHPLVFDDVTLFYGLYVTVAIPCVLTS